MDVPEKVRGIVAEARKETDLPLTAKIRLGESFSEEKLRDFCLMLEGEGIDLLTVHARLRKEAFCRRPHWQWVAKVKEWLSIPVVANGSVLSVADAKKCYIEDLTVVILDRPRHDKIVDEIRKAAIESGEWVGLGLLVAASIFTLASMLKIWRFAFQRTPGQASERRTSRAGAGPLLAKRQLPKGAVSIYNEVTLRNPRARRSRDGITRMR